MGAEITLEIIAAILKYGPEAIVKIADAMREREVTVGDIQGLFIEKDPEEYFESEE